MNQASSVPPPSRGVRIFHAALLAGLIVSGALFAFAQRFSPGPPMSLPRFVPALIAGLTILLLFVAARVVRPTIPERRFDQSSDTYWDDQSVRGRAIVLWALIEGSGLMAVIGYYLTDHLLPAIALVAAVLTMAVFRPSR
jgi:hypothetical protein